jgi:hypothetical protein
MAKTLAGRSSPQRRTGRRRTARHPSGRRAAARRIVGVEVRPVVDRDSQAIDEFAAEPGREEGEAGTEDREDRRQNVRQVRRRRPPSGEACSEQGGDDEVPHAMHHPDSLCAGPCGDG